ncbi:hypothetical protein HYW99_00745 [Candidatus Woesearchaeota archaeon]|nr:hypothetical protein [Candidatus Woesearchaeota archaeon]
MKFQQGVVGLVALLESLFGQYTASGQIIVNRMLPKYQSEDLVHMEQL